MTTKAHYLPYNSLPLYSIQSQINPFHKFASHIPKILFSMIPPRTPRPCKKIRSFCLSHQNVSYPRTCYMPRPSHSPLFHHQKTMYVEMYKSWTSPIRNFILSCVTFSSEVSAFFSLKADSHIACRAHAIHDHAVLLKATTQHSRRETACGLLARVRLLPATTRSSTKLSSDTYQSQMQVASAKPNTVCMDEEKSGSSTLQKRRPVTLLD